MDAIFNGSEGVCVWGGGHVWEHARARVHMSVLQTWSHAHTE